MGSRFVAAAGALSLSGYPVVAQIAGVPVSAPTTKAAWGACPTGARPISTAGMLGAKRAGLAALPVIAKQTRPPLNLHGVRVTRVSHTRKTGFIMPLHRACWGTPFARSVIVEVFLPAERAAPALRGNPWFYVARTSSAWVIWDEPH